VRGKRLARTDPKKLLERAEKAFTLRDANRGLFDDCYELYSPYRNTLSRTGQTHNRPSRQYDSTGQVSAQNFINNIQNNFTPVFTKWATLKAGEGVPEDAKENVNVVLEKITDQIFAYLNASNFATASTEGSTPCTFLNPKSFNFDIKKPLPHPISNAASKELKSLRSAVR
jgi:hypothetical protein